VNFLFSTNLTQDPCFSLAERLWALELGFCSVVTQREEKGRISRFFSFALSAYVFSRSFFLSDRAALFFFALLSSFLVLRSQASMREKSAGAHLWQKE
jgi:hypothetical protein